MAGLCVAALASVPVAEASEGSDFTDPWQGPFHYVYYQADPGETNNILAEPWGALGGGLHLKDTGAAIRWTYVPGSSRCSAECTTSGAPMGAVPLS